MVDIGSAYTWISSRLLKELEIKSRGTRRFKTIEGRILKREIGEAPVEYDGEQATTIVVFGQEGDAQVLGVHALEGLGYEVDLITKMLKKTEAFLAV